MVQVRSYVFDGQKIIPIEVELTLWPGLPMVQFLGRPDQVIRESALRIKSALKAQGFRFPKAQQILVNLRPQHIKKTSKGVELAVAMAYLLESGQIRLPQQSPPGDWAAYGELSLGGRVIRPDDLDVILQSQMSLLHPEALVTGPAEGAPTLPVRHFLLENLSDLKTAWNWAAAEVPMAALESARPGAHSEREVFFWSAREADLIRLVASGEHSLFLAGPAGSGKTSLAITIADSLLRKDSDRPLVRPHSRIPASAFLGGGATLHSGEVQRAHNGVLLLDEFLEFDSEVVEGLRQPLEDGRIRLARQGRHQDLPCRFLLLATSNLCPCGEWTPGQKGVGKRCRFSRKKCTSYSERFSGPLMDRFQMVAFASSGGQEAREVSVSWLQEQVASAAQFRRQSRGQSLPNSYAPLLEVEAGTSSFLIREMLPQKLSSARRQRATLRVARSLADLAGSPAIRLEDIRRALPWTYQNISRLQRWD